MSYLNRTQDPRHRATAMIAVGAVHAALAFGLVSGLAVDFVQHLPRPLTAIDVPLETPDPEPSDPPPPEPEPFLQFPTTHLPPIDRSPAAAPCRYALNP